GNQQVPPVATSASGVGTVVFSDVAVAAAYSVRVNGLDFGPATGKPSQTPSTADDVAGIHVHNAPRGANGAIVFGQIDPAQDNDDLKVVLNADNSWTVSGNWELSDPAGTSISAFAAQLNATPIGADAPLYFNIHTSPFPSGIIRGQWVAIANDAGNT
ncbi:CHRD domain-containing protein, partial [Corallococcus exiguus]|uniref:CHRD domain-containing protein n=1 Tax=Corallococcus exiguus TaxID=83462 RepID=UPI001474BA60